jgi:DNA-binding beta-propeller fold protein YncE
MMKMKRRSIFLWIVSGTILILQICGCDGGAGTSLPSPRSTELFVVNTSDDSVSMLDVSSDSAINPLGKLGGISLLGLIGIAVDAVNNEILAANGHSIAVYARTADGAAVPLRTISGLSTGLQSAYGIAVDAANNEILTADLDTRSVSIFSRTASGDISAVRTISGSVSNYDRPSGVAVDTVHNEIIVVNAIQIGFNSVKVYSRTASGNVGPMRVISGDSTGLNWPQGVAVDPINNEIFVLNIDFANPLANSILIYRRTSEGDVAPVRTITGGATELDEPWGIAIDVTHNEILVADRGGSILVYPRTASGDTAPVRVISGAATGLIEPSGIAVDPGSNEMVVANPDLNTDFHNSILVYDRSANGNAAPLRKISEFSTGIYRPATIAVDARNREIFLPGGVASSVNVYPTNASGNTSPIRNISGFLPGSVTALAADDKNDELLVLHATSRYGTSEINIYARTAGGSAIPLRRISPAPFLASALIVDSTNDEIFVSSLSSPPTPTIPETVSVITVYSRTAAGNVLPLRTITGSSTGLNQPSAMALDIANNEIFVANAGNDSITVYARTVSGNTAPLRSISGNATGLSQPRGIVVDAAHDVIMVSNFSSDSVTVYPRTGHGNVSPVKTVSGPSAGLNGPSAMALAAE